MHNNGERRHVKAVGSLLIITSGTIFSARWRQTPFCDLLVALESKSGRRKTVSVVQSSLDNEKSTVLQRGSSLSFFFSELHNKLSVFSRNEIRSLLSLSLYTTTILIARQA